MITEFLLNIIISYIMAIIDALGSIVTIPLDLVTVLNTIWGYGCFVLGSDLFVFCMSYLIFWFGVRFTIGLVVFIWHLIPFC